MATALAGIRIRDVAELNGTQRTAVLMMYLESEVVQVLLAHLSTEELQEIGESMAALDYIAPAVIEQVVAKFVRELRDVAMIPRSGREFALGVFPGLIDDARRPRVVRKLKREVSTHFADFIASRPPRTVATLLREEHPQTQAVALLLMGDGTAARVLGCMDEQERYDLCMRMAKVEHISNALADDVERALTQALIDGAPPWKAGGVDAAARTVGNMGASTRDPLLQQIANADNDLSETLRRRMLPFDALGGLDNRSLQQLLRNVSRELLPLALRGAAVHVRERFLSNISSRAAADLREEIDNLGNVPRSQIRTAQEEIVQEALKLQEQGIVALGIGDGEE